MTGPNPDAELDAALGITALRPAAVTDDHVRRAERLASLTTELDLPGWVGEAAQAIADAEQRGAARVIAEHRAGGTA